MINKRFLVPVLALAAIGLPVRGSVATYCSGSSSFCSANDATAFNNQLTADTYTLGGLIAFSASNGSLAGTTYTDSATGITFTDFLGNSLQFLAGGVLSTPNVSGTNYIEVTIPATIAAIELSVNITNTNGICLDAVCPAGEGFVGFINPSPSAPWTVEFGPVGSSGMTEVNNFSVAPAGVSQSETPEVGTLLLIGSGLIAMRWMSRLPRLIFRTPRTA